MHSIFYFDTEDSISPPEAGSDDIVLWIADVLSRYGVRGSFHVIGDKARTLEARGRRDVIDAVRRHDVSSHYNHGSIHPTTVERIAEADWDLGVSITLDEERPGFEDLRRIFGRCSGLTRHGGSYAPQIVHAAGLCGLPFYGVPFHPPGARAFWLANTLCFSSTGLVFEDDNRCGPGVLEGVYADDTAFGQQLHQFAQALTETTRHWDFTALFGCHPHRLNTTEYSCWNYYGGINRPNLQPPPQRTEAQKQVICRNFERYVRLLAGTTGVRITGLDELKLVFGRCDEVVDAPHLHDYAQRVVESRDVPLDERFSPAELLLAMAESVDTHQRCGQIPARVTLRRVIGPTAPAAPTQIGSVVPPEDLATFAQQIVRVSCASGHLPVAVPTTGGSVAPAQALGLLARAYVDLTRRRPLHAYPTEPREPYPSEARKWRPCVELMSRWTVFHPAIDFGRIAELTCWQAWSVKPARPR